MLIEKAVVNQSKCVGCGACIQICTAKAIKIMNDWKSFIDKDKCIGCGRCMNLCHRKAISFTIHKNSN